MKHEIACGQIAATIGRTVTQHSGSDPSIGLTREKRNAVARWADNAWFLRRSGSVNTKNWEC